MDVLSMDEKGNAQYNDGNKNREQKTTVSAVEIYIWVIMNIKKKNYGRA